MWLAERQAVSGPVLTGLEMRFGGVLKSGIVSLSVSASAVCAADLPPLEDNPRIEHEFLAAAIGDAIRKNCPSISSRMMRVFYRLNELRSYALSLGYTKEDFNRMRNSPEAKERLKSLRDGYLAEHGVTAGDVDGYCRLGQEEINKNSLTGWILRVK